MADPDPKKLKSLRPAPLGESSGTESAVEEPPTAPRTHQWTAAGKPISKLPPKRTSVKIACQGCRHKRIKCDGQRPRCGQCANRRTSCVYVGEQGETMSDVLKRKNASLEHENSKYKDLVHLLVTKSGEESSEILRRVKISDDPLAVVDEIRKAEFLLPYTETNSPSTTTDSENVTQLDQNALESSTIRVPALPWTNIAGDGLVSELVTNFFTWDGAYLFPSIDAEVFVQNMTSGDVDSSKWCSPLLVNAMCAQSCQTLPRAEEYGLMTNQNIPDRFLDEAKFLVEREQGRASIPTAQALMLMHLTMSCQGKDRAGRGYRQMALDIIRRLHLESRYRNTVDGTEMTMRERKLISKALWGLFLLESRIAFFYFEPSQLRPPQIPPPFGVDLSLPRAAGNIDVLGRPFEESSSNVPLVPGILDSVCSLSVLFYDVMVHNTHPERVWGNDADIYILKRLYSRLKSLENDLPPQFLAKNNFTPSTCFFKLDIDEVAFAIIQTLRFRTLFEMPASQPGTTIQELCLHHCYSTIETTETMLQSGFFHTAHWWYLYVAMHPLVLLLDRPFGAETFINACRLMRFGSERFQVCESLLCAVQAFAWATGQAIPAAAQQFLPERKVDGDNMRHGPSLSFALPRQEDIWELMTSGGTLRKRRLDDEEDIGLLVQNWMQHDNMEN